MWDGLESSCVHEFVNTAVGVEPCKIFEVRSFGNFSQEFHGFGFVTRFRWVEVGVDQVDIDSHDQSATFDELSFLQSLSGYAHRITCRKSER